jgi:hemerythrin-like domain-containing protein
MPIQIGRGPDHDFDEPLGLLSDCHRRIEHFLRVLVAIDERAAGGPLTAEFRMALEGALRYFTMAAPKHTADEEQSLFPRLRASGDPAAAQALELLDGLEHDHDTADEHHARVDTLVRRWLADDRLDPDASAELRERLKQLQALYDRHIAIEDRELFPAAARVLPATDIQQIGREMATRRQLRPGPITIGRREPSPAGASD